MNDCGMKQWPAEVPMWIRQPVRRHKKRHRIPEGFPDSEVAEIQEVLDTHVAESNEDDLEDTTEALEEESDVV
jgi:hypothetical protein